MRKIAIFFGSFTFFVMVFFVVFSGGYKKASLSLFGKTKELTADVSDGIFSVLNEKNLLRENELLRAQLSHKNTAADYIKKENEELRKALELSEKSRDKTVAAKVVAINTHGNFSITLNRGSDHGIRKGDVVVFGNALAGAVQEVFPSYSIFLPVTAEGRATGIMDRDNVPGMISGGLSLAKKNMCSLEFFTDSKACTGDEIVTSGLSDIYPAGLLVGEIHSIEKNITVKTEVDFFKTRIFSVILSQ